VRWYLQLLVSHRDLERMLADCGMEVDHPTKYQHLQGLAPSSKSGSAAT
jgi:transposase, IS6 family